MIHNFSIFSYLGGLRWGRRNVAHESFESSQNRQNTLAADSNAKLKHIWLAAVKIQLSPKPRLTRLIAPYTFLFYLKNVIYTSKLGGRGAARGYLGLYIWVFADRLIATHSIFRVNYDL